MTEIIDLQDALERVQDDKELLAELFDIYQEDFIVRRKALAEGIATNDLVKIKEAAHSLKGSSGNISAKPLYQACLKLETMAREGQTQGIKEIADSLDGYFEEVKIFAARFKKDIAG
jgi:HPt (histidine-containing phosphotransfer) domain-containing protein